MCVACAGTAIVYATQPKEWGLKNHKQTHPKHCISIVRDQTEGKFTIACTQIPSHNTRFGYSFAYDSQNGVLIDL